MEHSVAAIILAAGKGLRMGGDLPKQYMVLAGRPVLAHTLAAFDHAPSVEKWWSLLMVSHMSKKRRWRPIGGKMGADIP